MFMPQGLMFGGHPKRLIQLAGPAFRTLRHIISATEEGFIVL
jgi:hypothetical protein